MSVCVCGLCMSECVCVLLGFILGHATWLMTARLQMGYDDEL